MTKPFRLLFIFWFLLLSVGQIQAITLTNQVSEVTLNHDIAYWEDSSNQATLADVSSEKNAANFRKLDSSHSMLNLGFSNSTHWIQFSVNRSPNVQKKWILEIPYLGLNKADLYLPNGASLINGTLVNPTERPYFSRFYAFPIEVAETPQTFYIKVQSTYPITVPLRIIDYEVFNTIQNTENIIQFLYFGGLLSLLIYNFMLFVLIRDRKYLSYSLFTLLTGLAIFAGNGYARLYLWPNAASWDSVSQPCLLAFAGYFALEFSTAFLKTKRLLPKIHKLLLALQLIYLFLGFALALSLWIPIPIATLFQILFLISLLTPCIVMGVCLRNVRYKIKSSRYFLLAWGVLCVGAFIATARLLELWPSNWLTLYAFQISSGIEMLLFSFALAYRFQWERQQRELSQEALINSQREAVGALLLSEERLEKAVDIRTEKLQKLLLSEQAMREQYVRFGAKISHEFRNPLNIIESQTSMLEILPNNNPELIQKRAKVIHSAVSRLVRLFDQWLESDRLTHENHQINKQTLLLSTWLANLVSDCRDYHPEHTLVVEPSRENISALGDDHLLQIAVLNLIDNACKFSPPGSSITIGVKIEDYGIGIFVKDQGQGIPQEMLEKVLEPYEQIKEQKQTGGVGLGLAFVKGIMDAHDGRIEIISALNQGTTIILWIPEETV